MTFLLSSLALGTVLLGVARAIDSRTSALIGSRSYDKPYGGAPGARSELH